MRALEHLKVDSGPVDGVVIPAAQARARELALTAQRREARAEEAEARYGLRYDAIALCVRISGTLPVRPFRYRSTRWHCVENDGTYNEVPSAARRARLAVNENSEAYEYPRVIPDAALARYQEAKASHLFERFFVIEAV